MEEEQLIRRIKVESEKKLRFNMASWNMQGWQTTFKRKKIQKILAVKNMMFPDIICLQEAKNPTKVKGYTMYASKGIPHKYYNQDVEFTKDEYWTVTLVNEKLKQQIIDVGDYWITVGVEFN